MILSPMEARRELEIGNYFNPGPWINHSLAVGENAKLIAEKTEHLNSEAAYVFGLLHDIGRRVGRTAIMHTLDGYNYMMRRNQPEIAKICLTHSFPIKKIEIFSGEFDCSEDQRLFIDNFIKENEYDDYDKLIQLCDAITLPSGACIMEKRLMDVALRHGLQEHTLDKWRGFLELKNYFDKLCKCNIYTLLPNVIENSFSSLT